MIEWINCKACYFASRQNGLLSVTISNMMMKKTILAYSLMMLLNTLQPAVAAGSADFIPASAGDTIAGMEFPDRDYTIEGRVITIWEDSFLMDDGTGKVIVTIAPHKTYDLKLHGQDVVQVSGRMVGKNFKPLVLSRPHREPINFSEPVYHETAAGMKEIISNTERYRFTPPATDKQTTDIKADSSAVSQDNTSSSPLLPTDSATAGSGSSTLPPPANTAQ